MLKEFLFSTGNFIIYVLSAFAALIMGWLIWDSERRIDEKSWYIKIEAVGFWFIAAYLLSGGAFEFTDKIQAVFEGMFGIGLFLVALGLYYNPTPKLLVEKNKAKFIKKTPMIYRPSIVVAFLLGTITLAELTTSVGMIMGNEFLSGLAVYFKPADLIILIFIFVLLAIKYFPGMQKQLSGETWGFFFFMLSYLFLNISDALVVINDIRFVSLTPEYGILWILEKACLFIGFAIIGNYAVSFLKFRLKPQLFITFITFSLIIFFSVTIIFLLVLLGDFQKNTLFNLQASGKAIELSMVELQNDSILAVKALNNNSTVVSAISLEDRNLLDNPVQDILTTSGADFIIITNEAGVSLYETNDTEISGVNYSNDGFLVRALEGVPTSTIAVEEGVLAPTIVAKTYMAVVENERPIGAIVVGYYFDEQLVDALKKRTSLDVTIFADNVRAATTFTTEDGLSRLAGTVESDPVVMETVLEKGESYQGVINIFNKEYLATYSPLRDSDDNIIGMIFVGEPSKVLIAVAQGSVQKTLKLVSLLIVLSLIPTYFMVKKMAIRQMI